jgi:3-oxoacyl-[acyl-carrier protein] reductase
MSGELKGLSVVVTGGTRGIGKGIAERLVEAGAKVVVTGTQEGRPLPQRCEYEIVDFSSTDSLSKFLNVLKALSPDILINNAGINKVASAEKITDSDLDLLIDVNLRAPILCTRAVLPGMIERGWGRIVNICSIWGKVAKQGRSVYAATKLGLVGFTRVLALETAPSGVLANCISPTYVNTDLVKRLLSEEEKEKVIKCIPIGRMAEPTDIASLLLWLVSKENIYLTGQDILIDGGYTLT